MPKKVEKPVAAGVDSAAEHLARLQECDNTPARLRAEIEGYVRELFDRADPSDPDTIRAVVPLLEEMVMRRVEAGAELRAKPPGRWRTLPPVMVFHFG